MSVIDMVYYGQLYDNMKPKCIICKWDKTKHLKKYMYEYYCYQCAYDLYRAIGKDLKKIKDEIKKFEIELEIEKKRQEKISKARSERMKEFNKKRWANKE